MEGIVVKQRTALFAEHKVLAACLYFCAEALAVRIQQMGSKERKRARRGEGGALLLLAAGGEVQLEGLKEADRSSKTLRSQEEALARLRRRAMGGEGEVGSRKEVHRRSKTLLRHQEVALEHLLQTRLNPQKKQERHKRYIY